jgi:hypothetical protein
MSIHTATVSHPMSKGIDKSPHVLYKRQDTKVLQTFAIGSMACGIEKPVCGLMTGSGA